MELRSTDALAQINVRYGGVLNICSRLKTSPVEGKGHFRGGELEEGGQGFQLLGKVHFWRANWYVFV
jgi:hypothetical protein